MCSRLLIFLLGFTLILPILSQESSSQTLGSNDNNSNNISQKNIALEPIAEAERKQLIELENKLSDAKSESETTISTTERKIQILSTMSLFIKMSEEYLQKLDTRITKTKNNSDKEELLSERKRIAGKIGEQRRCIYDTLSGVTEEELKKSSEIEKQDLTTELYSFISPLLSEFHTMTAWPKELSQLNAELTALEARENLCITAIKNIREIKKYIENRRKDIKSKEDKETYIKSFEFVESSEAYWAARRTNTRNKIDLLKLKIAEGEKEAPSVSDLISISLKRAWQKIGSSLLIAICLFSLIVGGVRFLYRILSARFSPFHKKGDLSSKNQAIAHIIDLFVFYFSLILALTGVLIVLYIRNDILLITVLLLMIIWTCWSMRNEIPAYISRSRLMLNLGSLRVGERVKYKGLSWRVESINLFCEFRNPALEGGRLRIPMEEALTLVSRPIMKGESWFPTKKGDCYRLPSGERGIVTRQTVEQVCVDLFIGGTRIYTPGDFISESPEVLSEGFDLINFYDFDYDLQPDILTTVPDTLKNALMKTILNIMPKENIISFVVDFHSAQDSSLRLISCIKIKGNFARKYASIERMLNKTYIQVCNEQGWSIPYPQMQISYRNK